MFPREIEFETRRMTLSPSPCAMAERRRYAPRFALLGKRLTLFAQPGARYADLFFAPTIGL
jgi:hypothetical protein